MTFSTSRAVQCNPLPPWSNVPSITAQWHCPCLMLTAQWHCPCLPALHLGFPPCIFHPLLHPAKVADFHIFVSFAKVQGPEDQVHKRMETFSLSPFCYNRLLQSKVLDFVTILRMGEVSTIFQQQKTTKPLFLAVP